MTRLVRGLARDVYDFPWFLPLLGSYGICALAWILVLKEVRR